MVITKEPYPILLAHDENFSTYFDCKIYEQMHSLVEGHTAADTFMSALSKHRISYVFYNNCVLFSTWREGTEARTWFQFFQYSFGHVSGS